MFVCAACGQRYEQAGFCAADGHPLAETRDPLLGAEIGRYRLARLLGEGGMGQVYLGVQPEIGSRVAIKLLSTECTRNPELLERFFAEARAVNLIRHEHIVSVLDLARLPDGRPYIVMEFIDGDTLGAIVRAERAPLGGIVQVATEVLSALGAAHARGIVHRDLKPDNVIVTVEGHAKVLDFGIAKLAPELSSGLSPRTRTGALLGTPAYMAPEQISGAENVDPRTDLYAAGVVLFEAVTGRVPFRGDTLFDLMRAHLEQAPPSPRAARPELPAAFEEVILTALAKDPAHRFQSASAMMQALHHAARELPAAQWRPLSSRGSAVAGRPSLERMIQAASTSRHGGPVPAPGASTPVARGAPTVPTMGRGAPTPAEPGAPAPVERVAPTVPAMEPASAAPPRRVHRRRGGAVAVVAVAALGSGVAVIALRGEHRAPAAGATTPAVPANEVGSGAEATPGAVAAGSDAAARAAGAGIDPPPGAETVVAGPPGAARDPAATTSVAATATESAPGRRGSVTPPPPSSALLDRRTRVGGAAAPARGTAAAPGSRGAAGASSPAAPAGPTIVGGGSAADHGVHLGPGVEVGPGVVVGGGAASPGATLPRPIRVPADYDPRRFDARAYAPRALALARKLYPDAGFVRMDIARVFPTGLADLTRGDDDSSYLFRSKARSAPPPGVARNEEVEIACYVEVTVGAREVHARVRDYSSDPRCRWPVRPLPRCALAQVWKRAARAGARLDTFAKVAFLEDGQWFFDNEYDGEGITESYADQCP